MSLLSVRQLFVEKTGRYDLVTDGEGGDWSDNGADFYLKAAHQLLDHGQMRYEGEARIYRTLTVGDMELTFNRAYAVLRVFVGFTGKGKKELKKVSVADFRNLYGNTLKTEMSQGTPLHFAVWPLSVADEDTTAKTSLYADPTEVTDPTLKGIVFGPPADAEYVMEVWGHFSSADITNDADESVWTEEYPFLLVTKAKWLVEQEVMRPGKLADLLEWQMTTTRAMGEASGRTRILG